MKQATAFMLACYGQSQCRSMTEARLKVWTSKVERSIAGAPKLATLPPTNEECSKSPCMFKWLSGGILWMQTHHHCHGWEKIVQTV